MKKLIIIIIGIALLALWAYPYATRYYALKKAREVDTNEAYEKFIREYPESEYKSEIQAWLNVSRSESIDGYKNFTRNYPNSMFAKKVMERSGNLLWKIAEQENSLSSYENFVNEYPAHPRAQAAGGKLLHLRIQEARKELSQLTDIDGVIWDNEIGWPIVFADINKMDTTLPPIDLDDLIGTMIIVFQGLDPGVSIEPPGMDSKFSAIMEMPEHQSVRYIPDQIKGTHLGLRLFEADRMLKALGFGKDPLTRQRVTCSVPGFKTLPQLARQSQNLEEGYFGRIWFKPRQVLLIEDGNTILFDRIVMGVLSESKYSAPTEFARHFERNYDQFSRDKLIYKELLRVAKFVAMARWLKDKGRTNLNLSDYRLQAVDTPKKTLTVLGTVKETYEGMWIKQYVLVGGVILDTRNSYAGGGNRYIKNVPLNHVAKEILKTRPYKKSVAWGFQIGNAFYKAVAIPSGVR